MKLLFSIFISAILFSSCAKQETEIKPKMFPTDYLFAQRASPYGKIDQKAYLDALKEKENDHVDRNTAEGYDDPWNLEGPTNIGGRITDVEMLDNDFNTIFASTASGGIFKSEDQGDSWFPIFDDALSLSIGDMDISDSDQDIMYVGTGESNAGGGSLAYDGVGVYKSSNGGGSWTHMGLDNAGSIGKVSIDPGNPDRVYIATMGKLFENNQDRGVYRTTDGGNTWEQILYVSDSTGAIDLSINPNNPQVIYAAMWERIRTVKNRQYGGETSGVYQSTDGGDNWTELINGLPSTPSRKGRIGLAIAASNPNTVYAFYAQQGGSLEGVYKSENAGVSWIKKATEGISNVPYIWWFGKIFVDPTDEDNVYVASLEMSRSTDGGDIWLESFPNVHVDQHAIFVHPQNPQLVINGNDGGIYVSHNGGTNWTKSQNLPITQFYACEINPHNSSYLLGGSQDNSTIRTQSGDLDDWDVIYGGDGFRVTVDKNNVNIIYAMYQNGGLGKSINGGNSFNQVTSGISGGDRKNWNTPYVISPDNSDILYYGTNRLYRSVDQAGSWSAISSDLTGGPYPGILAYGTITSISVSELDPDKIYVGTDDGRVWYTPDGGNTYQDMSAGIPERWVTAVAASPHDPDKVYVTISGFRFGEFEGHVYMSENNGANWTDISSNLPDIPVNDIIPDTENENALYIATDVGVYYSLDDGANWEILGLDLPNVPVCDIDFLEGERLLIAGTYGRSLYSYFLPGNVSTSDQAPWGEVEISPNPAQDVLKVMVDANNADIKLIQIINTSGQVVEVVQYLPDVEEQYLDISKLESGLYYIILESQNFSKAHPVIKL